MKYPAKTLYAHPNRFFDVTDGSNASAPGAEGCDYLCTGVKGYDMAEYRQGELAVILAHYDGNKTAKAGYDVVLLQKWFD